ncbi:MAG: hypothetical protein ACRDJY_10875 [Thermoleophilaceae bacterium]
MGRNGTPWVVPSSDNNICRKLGLPDPSNSAADAASAGSTEVSFSVLKRPREPRDRLPRYAELSFGDGGTAGYDVDTDESRFAGRRAGVRLYLIPGEDAICISTPSGAGGCVTKTEAAEGYLFGQQIGPPQLASDEARSWGVLPDGPTQVTAAFADGSRQVIRVTNNVWAHRSRRGLRSVKWSSDPSSGSVRIPGAS